MAARISCGVCCRISARRTGVGCDHRRNRQWPRTRRRPVCGAHRQGAARQVQGRQAALRRRVLGEGRRSRGAARGKDRAHRGTAVVRGARRRRREGSQARGAHASPRSVKGSNAKSYWLTNSLLVTGDAKLARRLAKVLSGVTSVHAQKVYPLVKPVAPQVVVQVAAIHPSGASRRSAPTRSGRTGSPGRGSSSHHRHRRRIHPRGARRALPRQQPRRDLRPRLQLVGPVRLLPRRALRQRRPRHAHDGHDRRWRPGRPARAGHRRRPGRGVDLRQGLRGPRLRSASPLSSGQFMLAPTDLAGRNPDPSRAPDIVSNSWGNDDPNDRSTSRRSLAWRAVGIIPVFAAGNAGTGL